jgi:hypothetical protein
MVPPDRSALLRPLRPALVPVPAGSEPGVCAVCHSSCGPGYQRCLNCHRTACTPDIVPVSMSLDRGLLHSYLWKYKRSADALTRDQCTRRLAALLAVFMEHHDECLGPWDYVSCVPSVRQVAMSAVVAKLQVFSGRAQQVLESVRDVGRAFEPGQFRLTADVRGHKVLLLDDTYASGGHMFSAAACLQDSGATITGPLVIGRHLNPSGWEPSRDLAEWLSGRQWDEGQCCRCGGERRASDSLF